jgi:4-hydroxythreonine-4-phosphate dehydrogenase
MKIVITSGDTNGIGLETFIKGFPAVEQNNNQFALCVNIDTLMEYAKKMNLELEIHGDKAIYRNRSFDLIQLNETTKVDFGKISEDSGAHSAASIYKALDLTLSGEYDAMVTLPISKKAQYLAGWNHPGHTEMLAERCGVPSPLMVLFKDRIRVGIVTIHTSIKDVPNSLNTKVINDKIKMLHDSLKYDFAINKPTIGLLGLNPHAGESGSIGKEEIDYINDCVKKMSTDNYDVKGPFAADGYFAHGAYLQFHATLAMYHDQGLIPMKMLARGGGVNFTAGLPIVRTSPDHGTAFEIAGKGRANPQSTIDSINAAIDIANVRKKTKA